VHPGVNLEQVIEAGGRKVIHLYPAYHKGNTLFKPAILFYTMATQPFGTTTFKKLEVICVVNDASGIGIFVIYAYRQSSGIGHSILVWGTYMGIYYTVRRDVILWSAVMDLSVLGDKQQ